MTLNTLYAIGARNGLVWPAPSDTLERCSVCSAPVHSMISAVSRGYNSISVKRLTRSLLSFPEHHVP